MEWKQITPFLGWQDYMATGQPDLALAFTQQMHDRTMIQYLDATGVLDTSKMGRHIVDWMPDGHESDETVARGEFTASSHMSVSNGFAAHGLDLLSQILKAAGSRANATEAAQYAAEGAKLKSAIMSTMWNGTAFCDGICKEVQGNSRVMTNMFSLCFGLQPSPSGVAQAWHTVADWGLEQIGDYGAFWYFMALGSGYYAEHYDTPDDGTAVYTALTKCDRYSWCSGLRDDNLTMTRESWHDGTYSHEWGTSPIAGVVWGLAGLHQTAPAFASFTVKPKIASLEHLRLTVPTIRGYVNITAGPGALDVQVPCNSLATLCLPRSSRDVSVFSPETHRLLLDETEVAAQAVAGHLCATHPVGCGVAGAPRALRAERRV